MVVLIIDDVGADVVGAFIRHVSAHFGWFLADLAPIAPFSTALVALVASVLAYFTLRQRRLADNKTQWWARVEFATRLAVAEDDDSRERTAGELLLNHLQTDTKAATDADTVLLSSLAEVLTEDIGVDETTPEGVATSFEGTGTWRSKDFGYSDKLLEMDAEGSVTRGSQADPAETTPPR